MKISDTFTNESYKVMGSPKTWSNKRVATNIDNSNFDVLLVAKSTVSTNEISVKSWMPNRFNPLNADKKINRKRENLKYLFNLINFYNPYITYRIKY